MSNQKIMQRQAFLIADKQPEEITLKKTFQKPSERCGRPSDRLSRHQIKQAIRIATFDIEKQGRILRWKCPDHGDTNLSYRYQTGDGVHAWCESCSKTTHFDEYHFNGQEDNEE